MLPQTHAWQTGCCYSKHSSSTNKDSTNNNNNVIQSSQQLPVINEQPTQQINSSLDQPDSLILSATPNALNNLKRTSIVKQPTSNNNNTRSIKTSNQINQTTDLVEKFNNNVFQHHAYCINCIKQDHICVECEFILKATIDQNSIYCVIEKGELHEMKILNKKSVKEATVNTTTAVTTVQMTKWYLCLTVCAFDRWIFDSIYSVIDV